MLLCVVASLFTLRLFLWVFTVFVWLLLLVDFVLIVGGGCFGLICCCFVSWVFAFGVCVIFQFVVDCLIL